MKRASQPVPPLSPSHDSRFSRAPASPSSVSRQSAWAPSGGGGACCSVRGALSAVMVASVSILATLLLGGRIMGRVGRFCDTGPGGRWAGGGASAGTGGGAISGGSRGFFAQLTGANDVAPPPTLSCPPAYGAGAGAAYSPPTHGDGLAVAMGASPWDELTLDLPYDAQSTEAGGHGSGAFPHTAVDPGCPTFVLPKYHDYAGMGHRLSNWVMGLVAAISLPATLLHAPLDYASKPHYNYTGLDAFLGVGSGEWREDAAMAVYHNLTRVDLPRMDNYASMAKGGMFSPNGRVALWHARRAALTRKCYIM